MAACAMSDEAVRQRALDPGRSFIVQAPAGSGKTELLIQRYLRLLSIVREPEQIIAITFTRKAAAEMRSRIVAALKAAAGDASVEQRPETLALARAALARDLVRGWSLPVQPLRLRIETLDALNGWLAQQLPVLAGGVGGAQIIEEASAHYREAAHRMLEELDGQGPVGRSLRILAAHLDNSLDRLEALLAELLPKRDQWLRHLAGSDESVLRTELEAALERLVAEELAGVIELLPGGVAEELAPLLTHAAHHAADERLRRGLEEVAALPSPDPSRLTAWRCVAALLLTAEGQWRRQITRQLGFGPEHAEARDRFKRLLERLRPEADLRDALHAVVRLPEPRYSKAQWQILHALRIVLERLAAELRVLFAEQHAVDFLELALSAQQALGSVEAPSELLLALDQRIQHVLVDEFQDTSHSQLELLRLLTAGWQPDDGRTLFLVGDPMQSIYRFRDADVSLFLKVKERGIGDVRCEELTLERNFRSAPAIVDWVNHVFPDVFPRHDEIGAAAARFRPCRAIRSAAAHQSVQVHALASADPRAELARAIEILEDEQRLAPRQSLAVLVQSRSHLAGLHEHLAAKGWAAQAVEIDALNQLQLGQDLIGLTRALTHLGDRVAWLGLLRAPWCGLCWADLEALVGDAPDRAVWELMHDEARVDRLSADGVRRLRWMRAQLVSAFVARETQPLSRWVEGVWARLDGPACVDRSEELAAADQFFAVLDALGRHGDLDDPAALEAAFARAQAQSEPSADARIEIMTIHRAKGLEFDTVVLLGLGRPPRTESTRALYWMERVAGDGTDDLLMAPLPRPEDDDPLTRFVRRAERRRDLAERSRLLYVAATRARERLHLVGHLDPGEARPPSRSLLAPIWPHVAAEFERSRAAFGQLEQKRPQFLTPALRRLAGTYTDASTAAAVRPTRPRAARPEFEWANRSAAHVGTVVHRHLQRLAESSAQDWDAASIRRRAPVFGRELRLLGVEEEELESALSRAVEALCRVLDDTTGRWLLSEHEEARSELRVSLLDDGKLEHVRLDRTFIDEQGVRWIVDYKVSTHEGGEVESFLESEMQRYRPQLERYAALMAQIENRPIRIGLYFPLLQAFRSWSANGGERSGVKM